LEVGPAWPPSGKDERMERVECGGESVRFFFESLDMPGLDPWPGLRVRGRGGDFAVRDEHFVREALKQRALVGMVP
jgi:hypothetical protein